MIIYHVVFLHTDPNAIKSTGNTMFLKFHSDYIIGKKGFSASFSSKKKGTYISIVQINISKVPFFENHYFFNDYIFLECGSDGRGNPQDIGNGYCDDYNNTPECDYDGGDCCGTCVNKEYCAEGACCDCQDGGSGNDIAKSWIGNGNCDAGNKKAECQFDGGDCCPNPQNNGNGYCDDDNNIQGISQQSINSNSAQVRTYRISSYSCRSNYSFLNP